MLTNTYIYTCVS